MYVGFDIGGTSIKYGVLDESGVIPKNQRSLLAMSQPVLSGSTHDHEPRAATIVMALGSAPGSFKRRLYVRRAPSNRYMAKILKQRKRVQDCLWRWKMMPMQQRLLKNGSGMRKR